MFDMIDAVVILQKIQKNSHAENKKMLISKDVDIKECWYWKKYWYWKKCWYWKIDCSVCASNLKNDWK